MSARRQGWDRYQILILQAALVLQTLEIEATEIAPHLTCVERAEQLGHLRRLLARTVRDLRHRRAAYREAYGLRARLRRWWRGHTTNRSTP
jgi:hypothetical protein